MQPFPLTPVAPVFYPGEKHIRHSVHCLVGLVCILLGAVSSCRADAESEIYYIRPADLPKGIMLDAKGTLTMLAQEPMSIKFSTYEFFQGNRYATERLDLSDTRPVSGWKFEGAELWRFPAVSRSGKWLYIIWYAVSDKRTWVNIEELSRISPKDFSVDLEWYATPLQARNPVQFFTPSKMTFFQKPSIQSGPRVRHQEKATECYGQLYITEVRNSFAHIEERSYGFDTECILDRGWVLLRDPQQISIMLDCR